MTIDSADDSKISNRTITTNRISNRTYDSKSNRITKLRRSLQKWPACVSLFSIYVCVKFVWKSSLVTDILAKQHRGSSFMGHPVRHFGGTVSKVNKIYREVVNTSFLKWRYYNTPIYVNSQQKTEICGYWWTKWYISFPCHSRCSPSSL